MTHPVRVQLRRTKGWRLPPNTISVARPTRWGNPFTIGGRFMLGDPDPATRLPMSWCWAADHIADDRFTLIETRAQAVDFYRRLRTAHPIDLHELRGKNLACWCPLDQPCHADVLLELANQ